MVLRSGLSLRRRRLSNKSDRKMQHDACGKGVLAALLAAGGGADWAARQLRPASTRVLMSFYTLQTKICGHVHNMLFTTRLLLQVERTRWPRGWLALRPPHCFRGAGLHSALCTGQCRFWHSFLQGSALWGECMFCHLYEHISPLQAGWTPQLPSTLLPCHSRAVRSRAAAGAAAQGGRLLPTAVTGGVEIHGLERAGRERRHGSQLALPKRVLCSSWGKRRP